MTPKEKAIDLHNKYVNLSNVNASSEYIQYQAKKCALIAVDEIILNLKDSVPFEIIMFYIQVKQEIENL